MDMTDGIISVGWIVVNVRQIIEDYDGDEGRNDVVVTIRKIIGG